MLDTALLVVRDVDAADLEVDNIEVRSGFMGILLKLRLKILVEIFCRENTACTVDRGIGSVHRCI